jgi:hypothetical protein
MSKRILSVAAGVLAIAAFTTFAAAQAPERTLSVMTGGFQYDFGGDATSPIATVRLDRRLSNNFVAELGVSWALAKVDIVDNTVPEPTVAEGRSSLGTATVGVQAELPLGPVRPYVGIAAGLFGRVDHPEHGDRFLRTTMAFPVGVRWPLGDRLTVRGEARVRFDEHQNGASAFDNELLFGFGWWW